MPIGAYLEAKQATTVAIVFLDWLGHCDRSLTECTQHEVDAWFAEGPSTRNQAKRFLYWARAHRLIGPVELRRRADDQHEGIDHAERQRITRDLPLHETLSLPYRVAGCLITLFGQQAVRITELRLDVDLAADQVHLQLARGHWVEVPALLRSYRTQRRKTNTAANAESPWLFPDAIPGQPLSALCLVDTLRGAGIPVRATRYGTWQQLVRDAPPQVLAETLGISPRTAMAYADHAAADWTRYVGLRARPPGGDQDGQP